MSVLNSACPSGKLARWALTIQELNLTLKHHAGKLNANADALSRNPTSICVDDRSGDSGIDLCFVCPSVNYRTNVFTNDFCEGICDGAGEDKSAVSVDSVPVCVDICSAGEDQSVDSVNSCVCEHR